MLNRILIPCVVLLAGVGALVPLQSAAAYRGHPPITTIGLRAHPQGEMGSDRIEDTPAPPGPSRAAGSSVHAILVAAAVKEGVDPNLLLAVSYWESSWKQESVSSEGAIGLLQVMPKTAATAGPNLLGREVNLHDPYDNALVGAALLKDLLNKYGARTALAAYYQGEPALFSGRYAYDTWGYADGILFLASQIAAGQGPAEG